MILKLFSKTNIILTYKLFPKQFWSAFVPCAAQNKDAVQLTLEQIDVIQRLVEKYPQHLRLATSVTGK